MPGVPRKAEPPQLPAFAPFSPEDPAPAPHWSVGVQARAETFLQPATPAPLATLSVEPATPVPPLLIRRQLQLIETYEAAPEPASPEVSAAPAQASPPAGSTAAEQPASGNAASATSPAGGPTPGGSAELAVPDPDRAALLHELEVTRSELAELSQLVEELPAIFESKFRQRLEPILVERSRLLADNEQLRQQLQALPGSAIGARRLLLPEVAEGTPPPSRRRSRGLGGMVRRAFGLSDRDDGRTTAA